MNDFKFNLGSEVKDKITGFKGIIRGRTQYLTGYNVYGVQSQKLKDDKPLEWIWFDEMQITLFKKAKIKLNEPEFQKKKIKPGGPINNNQFAPQGNILW